MYSIYAHFVISPHLSAITISNTSCDAIMAIVAVGSSLLLYTCINTFSHLASINTIFLRIMDVCMVYHPISVQNKMMWLIDQYQHALICAVTRNSLHVYRVSCFIGFNNVKATLINISILTTDSLFHSHWQTILSWDSAVPLGSIET